MKLKALLYTTKQPPYLYKTEDTTYPAYPIGYHTDKDLKLKLSNTNELAYLNGKIVAECDYEVENIFYGKTTESKFLYPEPYIPYDYHTNGLTETQLCDKSKLNINELNNYLQGENGYAICIKNLNIFDKPRELSQYSLTRVTRGLTYGFYNTFKIENERVIIIAVSPQEACNILNHKQDVLVRRNVLKEML